MSEISILGGGAFGTALAIALGREHPVTLWARDTGQVRSIADARINDRHLPGVEIPAQVMPTDQLEQAARSDCLLLALPTQRLGGFLDTASTVLDGRRLVICCKGVDRQTGLRPSELVAHHCPSASVAVLTGPSFADDIARGLPTALTLATAQDGEALQSLLSTPTLRLYLTDDIVGAELGGALKNIIALAAGITIGAGLADSARAAVVTRGFAEITRYATAAGARPETLAGLSGLGDLILTCTSTKSRNFAAGIMLGEGHTLPTDQTIEGVATARAVSDASAANGLDMPLTTTVCAVTEGRLSVADAADALMSRPLKKE